MSALHELNAGGYAVAILAGLAGWFVWPKAPGTLPATGHFWHRWRHRFRRPFPLAFLLLAILAFLGGAIYAPTNYDGLTYRVPRVLHWLAGGQWHWIHSLFPRVNARASGFEWMSAPLIALTHSDRLIFLINTVSFFLLPGLVYSVSTRLGVRGRTAWHWMWLAPAGYCFLLQAGSIGNDLFGAPFALAAVDLALRARISRSPRDFFGSVLAAALMTGTKASSLPLLLPWVVAIAPSWPCLLRWPLRSGAIAAVALAASFVPNAIFDAWHLGDWSGTKIETTCVKSDPPLRTAANLALTVVQNLAPPVFPLAEAWNRAVKAEIPARLAVRLDETFVEPGASEFRLEEMQMEENAGLGFGVSLLLLASVAAVAGRRGIQVRQWVQAGGSRWRAGVRAAPLVSLLALASQSEIAGVARVLTPYYLLALPFFLASPAHSLVVRRWWWRGSAALVFLLSAMLLLISPARPLFPATRIFSFLHSRHPESAALERAATVYSIYRERNHAFAPVLAALPPDLKVLGLFTYDDPEASLWQPFGSRRIEHVRPEDTAEDLQRRGIQFVLIPPAKFAQWFHLPAEDWVNQLNATVIQKIPLELRIADGMADWWLVKLPATPNPNSTSAPMDW